MLIHYDINEADFLSSARLLYQSRRSSLARRVLRAVAVLLLILICAFMVKAQQFPWGLWPAVLFLLLIPAIRALITWYFKRVFRRTSVLHGPRSLETDPDGLRLVSTHAQGRAAWSLFERFAENDRTFILVQVGGQIFLPIPKRDLTPDTIDHLRGLFLAGIRPR